MNDELLKNFFLSNNYSPNTEKNARVSLNQYSTFHNMSLQELLDEAEEDENKGTRWKYSKLKTRLLEYRMHLVKKYAISTTKTKIKQIIKFYRFYEIEVPPLPKLNEKSVKKTPPVYYKDLPDKEIIREALNIAKPVMRAIILFMCSSGSARAETMSLTIQDYIDALSEYLPNKKMDIYDIIDYLHDTDNIVPTFNILRNKTNKYYTTYCSPEAVKAINTYLVTRTDNLEPDSPLFGTYKSYLFQLFQEINDELGLGRVGNYRRLRSHMLRKFHASALYNDGMSLDKVNDLQGKTKNQTDSAYFMTNPDDLKYEYIAHLPAVTINTDVEKLSIKSPEFIQIETENKELQSEIEQIKGDIAKIIKHFGDGSS